MKRPFPSMLAIVLIVAIGFVGLANPLRAVAYSGAPSFSIITVVTDKTVKIQTYNFPANDSFTVRMGAYGTLGVNGTVVGTQDSSAGGSFSATYDIPSGLKGAYRIAIRLESSYSGYFAYNWFYNAITSDVTATPKPTTTPGPSPTARPPTATPAPGYSGYPYFNISAVVQNKTVKILAYNFPANDSFTVRMGAYGTLGINGTVVGTQDSGNGGGFTAIYTIPAGLAGSAKIAIRLESASSGYFAYNWFYNNTYP